jgi:ArsR family transcriptional regulator
MEELKKAAKALSDETRLRIINLLMERECCVCEVMQALDISQTRASRNLGILHNAGLLKVRRHGLWVLYSIKTIAESSLIKLLEAVKLGLASEEQAQIDLKRLRSSQRRASIG